MEEYNFVWHPRGFFAFTDGDEWRVGIGDPTVVGWLTVVAYFVAALLSFFALWRCGTLKSREGMFWFVIFVAMVLLGINKQLDLQTWVTLTARKLAIKEGWYANRRIVQIAFILFIALAGVLSFCLIWRLGHGWRSSPIVLAGFLFLCCFVVIRAASFHHVDLFLKYDIGGMRMNWLLELGGIALIAIGTWKNLHSDSGRSLT